MMEIDIIKASSNQKPFYEDIDIAEADTALNTPTLTDRRFSSTSSNSSYTTYKSYTHRKPFNTPKYLDETNEVILLEKKLQLLEQELNEHVKREIDLESQLVQLKRDSSYKNTFKRMSSQIDQFLVKYQHHPNAQDRSIQHQTIHCIDWLMGNELPILFSDDDDLVMQSSSNTDFCDSNDQTLPSSNKVFIFRLKSIIERHQHDEFYNEFKFVLNSWEASENHIEQDMQDKKSKENQRTARLLEALNKSLNKNKVLRRDSNLLMKKYQVDLKNILKDSENNYQNDLKQITNAKLYSKQQQETTTKVTHEHCEKKFSNLTNILEQQIKKLDQALVNCQEERDEYEKTLEIVRREMETMLEELEDTRQQRLRFKTQASRLRAGLEAIQKRNKKPKARQDGVSSSSDDEDEDEDEGKEALRLMYNEAERQAMDLDRECKRQALTLNSIRKELKLTEEKYQSIKTEKNKQQSQLEKSNRDLSRRVELLQVEKQNLIQEYEQKMSLPLKSNHPVNEDWQQQQFVYQAKIYALQIALKAAKSDASIQRTKIYQLERQASLLDVTNCIVELQDMFQKELVVACQFNVKSNDIVNKQIADTLQMEQMLWKDHCKKSLQKKYDVNLLRVNREIRFLSGRIIELEDETKTLSAIHEEEMSRIKHQIKEDEGKKLHQVISCQKLREQDLHHQLDVMHQKNQTLHDEVMALCGRNMIMAQELGKLDSLRC